MTVLADKLIEAFNVKNNSIESFVWKGEKKHALSTHSGAYSRLLSSKNAEILSYVAFCCRMLRI